MKQLAWSIFRLGNEPCVSNFEKCPLLRPGEVGAKQPSNSPELLEVTLLMLYGELKRFTVISYIVLFMLK